MTLERARQVWRQRNPGASPELQRRADELLENLRTIGRAQWVLDYEDIERQDLKNAKGPL